MSGDIKKVLITCYWFPPVNTPRAFRVNEIIKEMSRRGYEIDVFTPKNINKKEKLLGVNYYNVINSFDTSSSYKDISMPRRKTMMDKLVLKIKNITRYLIGGNLKEFIYGLNLKRKILSTCSNSKYDLIISIGLPFYVHWATAVFIYKSKQEGISVCDYGDPFFSNPASKKIFYFKYIEKWVVNNFNYISVPNSKSIDYYTSYKTRDWIKVIPQGFDFTKTKINEYKKNSIPTFCYAGIFYKKIRNPEFFFEFLSSLEIDFRFIIYTHINDEFLQETLAKYKHTLSKKVVLKSIIPRDEIIKEMSKMDFLINIENENSYQVPSKLIDYTLSDRPILSISGKYFDKNLFFDFVNENYESSLKVNIEDYNIVNVVNKFENLFTDK